MAVKIRLKRMGKIRAPFYRVVIMDSRTKRDGRAIEEIGKYHPTEEPSLIDIDGERAQYWLKQGAQPTEAVEALLKITGDWQAAKGLPGAEGTLKVKEAKPSKKDLYEAAVAAAGGKAEADEATGGRKKSDKKADKAADKNVEKEAKADKKADEADAVAKEANEVVAEADGSAEKATEAAAFADTTPDSNETEKKAAEAAGEPAKELPEGAHGALEDGSAPEGYTIKGNQDSMKYHEPDGQWYEQTIAEVWFKTAEDAEKAGFVKAGS